MRSNIKLISTFSYESKVQEIVKKIENFLACKENKMDLILTDIKLMRSIGWKVFYYKRMKTTSQARHMVEWEKDYISVWT